ncbi:flagellar MS-ring protein [Poriferisphaera corsica]|uniref:Flagellar MS-ring protein n=1 Tax=Poriferisphaera corsica TaxID=2528020 RepID=A0A517YSG1_9BACT|nr:hypothetical protein [Poriferisphaera corsica]QDU33165.1 flagellar MS-ring protein [Poriferisphaera corsica]
MEVLKRSWAQIAALFGGLNKAERALIIALLVIVVGFLWGIVIWSGQTDQVRLTGIPLGTTSQAAQQLKRFGVQYEIKNDMIYVSQAKYLDALAYLSMSEVMQVDLDAALLEMQANQNAWMTEAQIKNNYRIAVQRVCAAVISKMTGIKSATVQVGEPTKEGFGAANIQPTASVSVILDSANDRLNKKQVESIAGVVSGPFAKMDSTNVSVIDLTNGETHRVGGVDEIDTNEILAQRRRGETELRNKILNLVSEFRGAKVEVSIQTDNIAKKETNIYTYDKDPLSTQEKRTNRERQNIADSGEPGVTSNTGLSIAGSQQAGMKETEETSDTVNGERPITEVSHVVKGAPEVVRVSATVKLPRSFFATKWKIENPDNEDEPKDADLLPLVGPKLTEIEEDVLNLLNMADQQSANVRVSMMDDTMVLAAANAGSGMGGPVGTLVELGVMKHAGSIALGVVAVGLMLWMVRSATKPEKLPTVEELAGIPPELPSEEDLVGEVDEQETTMAGYELDEGELQSRRIAEQISDLIKNNPNEAANIFGRWVRTDD